MGGGEESEREGEREGERSGREGVNKRGLKRDREMTLYSVHVLV